MAITLEQPCDLSLVSLSLFSSFISDVAMLESEGITVTINSNAVAPRKYGVGGAVQY